MTKVTIDQIAPVSLPSEDGLVWVSEPDPDNPGSYRDAVYSVNGIRQGAGINDAARTSIVDESKTYTDNQLASSLAGYTQTSVLDTRFAAKAERSNIVTAISFENGQLVLTRAAGNLSVPIDITGGAPGDVVNAVPGSSPGTILYTRRDGTQFEVEANVADFVTTQDLLNAVANMSTDDERAQAISDAIANLPTAAQFNSLSTEVAGKASTDKLIDNAIAAPATIVGDDIRVVFTRADGSTADQLFGGLAALFAKAGKLVDETQVITSTIVNGEINFTFPLADGTTSQVEISGLAGQIASLGGGQAPLSLSGVPSALDIEEGASSAILDASATGGASPYVFSVASALAVSIDSSTGLVTWDTAAPAFAGDASDTNDITVTVTDADGTSESLVSTVTITQAATAPLAITVDPTTATFEEGATGQITAASATGGDGTYVFTVEDNPYANGIGISGDPFAGTYRWSGSAPAYTNTAADVQTLVVKVTDGTNATATASVDITIIDRTVAADPLTASHSLLDPGGIQEGSDRPIASITPSGGRTFNYSASLGASDFDVSLSPSGDNFAVSWNTTAPDYTGTSSDSGTIEVILTNDAGETHSEIVSIQIIESAQIINVTAFDGTWTNQTTGGTGDRVATSAGAFGLVGSTEPNQCVLLTDVNLGSLSLEDMAIPDAHPGLVIALSDPDGYVEINSMTHNYQSNGIGAPYKGRYNNDRYVMAFTNKGGGLYDLCIVTTDGNITESSGEFMSFVPEADGEQTVTISNLSIIG